MEPREISGAELRPKKPLNTEDVVKELENVCTQLYNMQTDFLRLGMIICALLIAIVVVIWIKM